MQRIKKIFMSSKTRWTCFYLAVIVAILSVACLVNAQSHFLSKCGLISSIVAFILIAFVAISLFCSMIHDFKVWHHNKNTK